MKITASGLALQRHGGVRLAGGSFAGVYDAIPSIAAAYGMRRLRSLYTGNLLRLRRDSDNAESNFGYTAAGDLDTAAIATWLGAASGYVTTWYDQSGNGYNAVQTTAANQPLYVASGQNGKPVGRWDGINDSLIVASITLPTFFSLLVAAKFTTAKPLLIEHSVNAANNDGFFLYGSNNDMVKIRRGIGNIHSVPGLLSWMTANWSVVSAVYDGTHLVRRNAVAATNGTPTGTALSNSNATAGLYIGSRAGTSVFGQGDLAELVIGNIAWSAAQYQAAEVVTNSYWGVY